MCMGVWDRNRQRQLNKNPSNTNSTSAAHELYAEAEESSYYFLQGTQERPSFWLLELAKSEGKDADT